MNPIEQDADILATSIDATVAEVKHLKNILEKIITSEGRIRTVTDTFDYNFDGDQKRLAELNLGRARRARYIAECIERDMFRQLRAVSDFTDTLYVCWIDEQREAADESFRESRAAYIEENGADIAALEVDYYNSPECREMDEYADAWAKEKGFDRVQEDI